MGHTSHFDFCMLKDMVKNIWNIYGYSKHPLDVLQNFENSSIELWQLINGENRGYLLFMMH